MLELLDFFSILNLYISIICSVLGLSVYFKSSTPIRFLILYFVFASATALVSNVIILNGGENLKLFTFYSIMEFVVLGKLFENIMFVFNKNRFFSRIFYPLLIIILAQSYMQIGTGEFNTISGTIVGLLIVGFSIWFFKTYLEIELPTFQVIILKWLVISIFLYQCVTLIVLLFGNQLIEFGGDEGIWVWIFRTTIVFISKLIAMIAFGRLAWFEYCKKKLSNG